MRKGNSIKYSAGHSIDEELNNLSKIFFDS